MKQVDMIIYGIFLIVLSLMILLVHSFVVDENILGHGHWIAFDNPDSLPRTIEIKDTVAFTFSADYPEPTEYMVIQENYNLRELVSSNVEGSGMISDGVIPISFDIRDKTANIALFRVIVPEYGTEIHFWASIYDKRYHNRTFVCGLDLTDYQFDTLRWDYNDPVVKEAVLYCPE